MKLVFVPLLVRTSIDPFLGLPQMIDNIPNEIVAILSLHDIAIKVASLHKIIIGMSERLCEYDSMVFLFHSAGCPVRQLPLCRMPDRPSDSFLYALV